MMNNQEQQEVLQFIGGTIGALKELDSKVISKTNPFTQVKGIDKGKIIQDFSKNFIPQNPQQIPQPPAVITPQQVNIPQSTVVNAGINVQPQAINLEQSIYDPNQLELDFNQKFKASDLFYKVDRILEIVKNLEQEVRDLKKS